MPDSSDPKPDRSEMLSKDADLLEIVQAFVLELPERVAHLSAACDDGRLEEMRVLAHRLKGASGTHGYLSLCDRAAALERLATAGSRHEMNAVIREINNLVAQIQDSLNPK